MQFALLEDFDHLYRYADLLDMEDGVHAERLVGSLSLIHISSGTERTHCGIPLSFRHAALCCCGFGKFRFDKRFDDVE